MSTPRKELQIDEAPSVFHLSDHPSPESYEDSVAVEKCPVCRGGRHPLYCADCVKNEELSHRNFNFKSFEHGMRRLHRLATSKEELTKKIDLKMRRDYDQAEQKRMISIQKEKLASLQNLISTKNAQCDKTRRAIVQKRSDNKRLERTVDKIRKRLPLMGERVKSLSVRLTDKHSKQESLDTRLATRRREVVTQVERFVFSLKPVPDSSMHESDDSIARELADASGQQFVRGRWARVGTAFTILASQLLSSGDLIELQDFCAENTGGASSTPRSVANGMKSVALEEWAALSYLSQFSHCVAHILDINLPYTTYIPRITLDTLSSDELSNFIAQLDFNVSYLSCSQGVDMLTYDPRRNIQNMYSLIHHCDNIGRTIPFSLITTSLLQSVEERITNAYIAQQYDGEKCDEDESNWLIVTETPPTETSAVQTMSYAASASDLVSSAVNVMSSYWPFKQ